MCPRSWIFLEFIGLGNVKNLGNCNDPMKILT
jgi:hypothetical protein